MNKVFRIVWSHVRQAFVVVDEHASAQGKRSATRVLLAAGMLSLAQPGVAMASTNVCTSISNSISSTSAGYDTCELRSNASVYVTGDLYNQNGNAIAGRDKVDTIINAGGTITASANAIDLGGGTNATGNVLRNEANGLIQGGDNGVVLHDNYTLGAVQNYGEISANSRSGTALLIDGSTIGTLVNYAGGSILNVANGQAIRLQNGALIQSFLYNMENATIGSAAALDAAIYGENSRIEGLENGGTIRNAENAEQSAVLLGNGFSIGGNLYNSGTIEGGQGAVELSGARIEGDIVNTSTGRIIGHSFDMQNGGVIQAAALQLNELSQVRDILNAGTIYGHYSGLDVLNSSSVRNIVNSGRIEGDLLGMGFTGGASAERVDNQRGGLIQGQLAGVLIEDSSQVDSFNNAGRIVAAGPDSLFGMAVLDDSRLTLLTNSGTIQGTAFALWVDGGSTRLDEIHIEGNDSAVFLGDVTAKQTDLTVKSGATFSNTNAFDVQRFTVESGATFKMGEGLSSSASIIPGMMQDGITVSEGLHNNGVLALAAGVTGNIHGDYDQSSSGKLRIGVSDDASYGKLVVDGTATLASNAKIEVNVSPADYKFTASSLQNVLSATTLNSDGTFAVSDNSTLFNFGAVKDGNTVDLTLAAAAGTGGSGLVEQTVRSLGNSPAAGAARVLDQTFAANPTGELAALFVPLTSGQQISDAVTSTLPTVAGSVSNATSSTLAGINRVIQARQDTNSGLSSGDVTADDNLWIKTFGSWADQDARSGVSGFDAETTGLAIGADAAVSAYSRLGVAFAYAKTNLDSDSRVAPQSADIDTFLLIGYGSYALGDDTELNFQLDVGQNRNDTQRQIPFANTTAKSDYDSYSAHAGVGIGHTLKLSEQLAFVPSARVDYTWIGSEGYKEKGADALNLNVDGNDTEELLFSVDGKLNYAFSQATVLSANLGAGYDAINERSSISSIYAGAPGAVFSTPGMDMEPWLARAGLGLTHTLDNGTEVSLHYDAEARSDFTNQGTSIKARWAF